MTFIQPNKNQNSLHLIVVLGMILISAAVFYVYLYSRVVTLKHDMSGITKELEELRVQNAELKNQFYSLVDSRQLEALVEENNLVYDKNPQWAFVSRF